MISETELTARPSLAAILVSDIPCSDSRLTVSRSAGLIRVRRSGRRVVMWRWHNSNSLHPWQPRKFRGVKKIRKSAGKLIRGGFADFQSRTILAA